jgi:GT2 family glycosyltransferase
MFSIIIPVHNQLGLVAKCIESVIKNTKQPYSLVVINDGSDEETTTFLNNIRQEGILSCLLRNEQRKGFSYSCNKGIKAIKADYYCLLNSDTEIGTYDWTNKIREVNADITGVLSNNATSQSIPTRDGDELIEGYTPIMFGQLIELLSEKRYPETIFVNGFCYIIKQQVIDKIGLLDEEKYPHYGSEDEYTFTAKSKGFTTKIADNVFVYHKSNQSYKLEREGMIKQTVGQFIKDWGQDKVVKGIHKSYQATDYLREKVNKIFKIMEKTK